MSNTATDLSLATAEVDFAVGNLASWDAFQLPIPQDILIITTDTLEFRLGTGSLLFGQLSDSATIAGIQAGASKVSNLLTKLTGANNSDLIINTGTGFGPSGTTLTSISARLTAIQNDIALQNTNIASIQTQTAAASSSITTGDNGDLVVLGGHQMTPGVSPSSIVTTTYVSSLIITSINAFSDAACTLPVTSFAPGSTYYIKLSASHDTVDTNMLTLSLASNNTTAVVSSSSLEIFEVSVSSGAAAASVTFTGTASYQSTTVNSAFIINIT